MGNATCKQTRSEPQNFNQQSEPVQDEAGQSSVEALQGEAVQSAESAQGEKQPAVDSSTVVTNEMYYGGLIRGGVTGGGSAVVGGYSSLAEYGNSMFSKAKGELIRSIAKDVAGVLKISSSFAESADLKDVIAKFEKVVPDPRQGRKIKASKTMHIELCKKLANAINKSYKMELINVNDSAENICKSVSELLYSLFTGLHSEFITVAGDITTIMRNLNALQEYVDGINKKLIEDLQTCSPGNASLVKDSYDALSREIRRQHATLANLSTGVIGPVGSSLISILEETKSMPGLADDLRASTGTNEFSDKLSYMMKGTSSVAHASYLVDKALKQLGMSVSEYKNTKNMKELRSKIYDILVKDKPNNAQMHKMLVAADILYRNDLSHKDIVEYLNKKGGAYGGDFPDKFYGDGDGYADMVSDTLYRSPDGVFKGRRFANQNSIGTELHKRNVYRERLFGTLYNEIQMCYNQIISELYKVGKKIGNEIVVSDKLRMFIRQLGYLAGTQPDKKDLHKALSGFRRDVNSEYIKHDFLKALDAVRDATSELSESNGGYFKNIENSITRLIKVIDDFNDTFTKALTEVHVDVAKKGGAINDLKHLFYRLDDAIINNTDINSALKIIYYGYETDSKTLNNLILRETDFLNETKDYDISLVTPQVKKIIFDAYSVHLQNIIKDPDDNTKERYRKLIDPLTENGRFDEILEHAKQIRLEKENAKKLLPLEEKYAELKTEEKTPEELLVNDFLTDYKARYSANLETKIIEEAEKITNYDEFLKNLEKSKDISEPILNTKSSEYEKYLNEFKEANELSIELSEEIKSKEAEAAKLAAAIDVSNPQTKNDSDNFNTQLNTKKQELKQAEMGKNNKKQKFSEVFNDFRKIIEEHFPNVAKYYAYFTLFESLVKKNESLLENLRENNILTDDNEIALRRIVTRNKEKYVLSDVEGKVIKFAKKAGLLTESKINEAVERHSSDIRKEIKEKEDELRNEIKNIKDEREARKKTKADKVSLAAQNELEKTRETVELTPEEIIEADKQWEENKKLIKQYPNLDKNPILEKDAYGGDNSDFKYLVTMKKAIREIEYYFKIANIKYSLKIAASQKENNTKNYENILGEECAMLIDVINSKFKKLTCESTNNNIRTNRNIGEPNNCIVKQKICPNGTPAEEERWKVYVFILEYIRSAKVEMIEAAQSLDLYLSKFTEQVQMNPDDIKDFLKLLEQLEIVSKWFTDKSGDNLTHVFEAFPNIAGKNGAAINPVNTIPNHPLGVSISKSSKHYYEDMANVGSSPGNWMAGVELDSMEKARDFIIRIEKSLKSMRALENIVAMFTKLSNKVSGDEIRTFMAPGLMFKAFTKYAVATSIALGKHESYILHGMNLPQAILPNPPHEGSHKTYISWVSFTGNNTVDSTRIRTAYLRPVKGRLYNDVYWDPLELGEEYLETDDIFEMCIKSMVSKVFTVVGAYSLYNRPSKDLKTNKSLSNSHLRQIMGGGASVKIIPEAVELYIRLTLLGEWYRELFKFSTVSVQQTASKPILVSMIPSFDGVWYDFVKVIFVETENVNDGGYTVSFTEDLINSINTIYMHYKPKYGADICMKILENFVAEVNMRYGLVKQEEINNYVKQRDAGLEDNAYESDDNVDFDILESKDQFTRNAAPSDKFVSESHKMGKTTSVATKKLTSEIKKFRELVEKNLDLNGAFSTPGSNSNFGQLGLKYASVDDLILQTTRRIKDADSDEKKYKIVQSTILGVEKYADVNYDIMLMFHETVINPLTILYTIYRMVNHFNRFANSMHLEENKDLPLQLMTSLSNLRGNKKYRELNAGYAKKPYLYFESSDYKRYFYFNAVFQAPIHYENLMEDTLTHLFYLTCDKNPMIELYFSGDGKNRYPMLSFKNLEKFVTELLENVSESLGKFRKYLPHEIVSKYENNHQKDFELSDDPKDPNVVSLFYLKEHLIDRLIKNKYGGGLSDANEGLRKIWLYATRSNIQVPVPGGLNAQQFEYGRLFARMIYWDSEMVQAQLVNNNKYYLFPTRSIRNNEWSKFPINVIGLTKQSALSSERIAGDTNKLLLKFPLMLRDISSAPTEIYRGVSSDISTGGFGFNHIYDYDAEQSGIDVLAAPASLGNPAIPLEKTDKDKQYSLKFNISNQINNTPSNDLSYNQLHGISGAYGLIFKLNRMIYHYINMFTDRTSNKIYLPLLEKFANGINAREIMKGYAIDDISSNLTNNQLFTYPATGARLAIVNMPANQFATNLQRAINTYNTKPSSANRDAMIYNENALKFCLDEIYALFTQHEIEPQSVLFATMARAIRNIVTDKKQIAAVTILTLAEPNLLSVSDYMKDLMTAYLPIFEKQINILCSKAELFKSVIENTRVSVKKRLPDAILDKVVAGGQLYIDPRQVERDGIALPLRQLSGTVGSESNCKNFFITMLTSIISTARSLQSCVKSVYKELADVPLYFETYQNSITDYKNRNGMLPLMPLSHVSHLLNNQHRLVPSNDVLNVLPGYLGGDVSGGVPNPNNRLMYYIVKGLVPHKDVGVGSDEFKFAYGTRGLLADNSVPNIEYAPGVLNMLDTYNNKVGGGASSMDKRKLTESFVNQTHLLRFATDYIYHKTYLGDNNLDKLTEFFIVSSSNNNTNNLGNPSNDLGVVNPLKRINVLQHLSCQTGRHSRNTANMVVNGILATNDEFFIKTSNISLLIENDNFKQALYRMLNCIVNQNQHTRFSDRKTLRIYNILDSNIVPINFHALQREIPLINIFNYSYTFDQMIKEFIGVDTKNRSISNIIIDDSKPMQQLSLLADLLLANPTSVYIQRNLAFKQIQINRDNNNTIASMAHRFLRLSHQCVYENGNYKLYPSGTPVPKITKYPEDALVRFLLQPRGPRFISDYVDNVFKLAGGSDSLSLNRPKYLSDQLWNKVLLNSLYSDITYARGINNNPTSSNYNTRPFNASRTLQSNEMTNFLLDNEPLVNNAPKNMFMNFGFDKLTYLNKTSPGLNTTDSHKLLVTPVANIAPNIAYNRDIPLAAAAPNHRHLETWHTVGYHRYQTTLIRYIEFFVHIQRVMRHLMRKELSWVDDPIVHRSNALHEQVTDYSGNRGYENEDFE